MESPREASGARAGQQRPLPARAPPRRGHRPEPPVTGPAGSAPRDGGSSAPGSPRRPASPTLRPAAGGSAEHRCRAVTGSGVSKKSRPLPTLPPRARSSPCFPAATKPGFPGTLSVAAQHRTNPCQRRETRFRNVRARSEHLAPAVPAA